MSFFRNFKKLFTHPVLLKNIKLNKYNRNCVRICALSAVAYSSYNIYKSRGASLFQGSAPSQPSAGIINFDFVPKLYASKVYDPGTGSGDQNHSSNDNSNKSLSQRYNFIADVVEKIAPGVVYIEIQGRHPFNGSTMPISNGSGFIVREDGLIMTNAHVVANRDKVQVKLHDGRVFTGIVQTADVVSDLATIKIDCKGLPTLKFGASSNLRPGEWVVAMGSPLTLSNTITAGVISSVSREGKELGLHNKNMEYIQTDAAITFGNSGGPLVNLDGEVIGINTMKVTSGISFAIPSDIVKEFLKESEAALKSGSWFGFNNNDKSSSISKKRYMGITMLTLTPSIISELQNRDAGFPRDAMQGVLVCRVVVGSPAYNGGLLPGDVIIQINDGFIKSASDVYGALEKNEKLQMMILRKQQKLTLTIVPQVSS